MKSPFLRGYKFQGLAVFAEHLPHADNRVTLHPTAVGPDGLPQLDIRVRYGENERLALAAAAREACALLERAGGTVTMPFSEPDPPGAAIHEMGGARMGRDPRTSVLTARACAYAVEQVKAGAL